MRFALLASAAFLMSAGLACAQTSSSTPAPDGAPNAAQASPGESPGKMAPAGGGMVSTPQYSQDQIKTSSSASAPAADGSPSAASANPGEPAGKMAPATAVGSEMSPTPKHLAMAHGSGQTMPENADARTYLHMAADAIKHHDKFTAEEALDRAETRLLTRSVPESSAIPTDDSPAVTAIEHAHAAVAAGDFEQASIDTKEAMHAHRMMADGAPMSSSSMSSPMSSPAPMSPPMATPAGGSPMAPGASPSGQ
jgi:hypothetical protein